MAQACVEAAAQIDPENEVELVHLLNTWAQAGADDETLPAKLVREYYIPLRLPLHAGMELIESARALLLTELAEARKDPFALRRRARTTWLAERVDELEVLTARFALEHHDWTRAESLARSMAVRANDGYLVRTGKSGTRALVSGAADGPNIVRAAALAASGDEDSARQLLSRVLGFIGDPALERTYRALRARLTPGGPEPERIFVDSPLAPDLDLRSLDGSRITLAQHRGRVVVVAFWATWCAPCLPELRELRALASSAGPDVVVITVNVDERLEPSEISRFQRQHGLEQLTVLRAGPTGTLGFEATLPSLIVIDAEGRLVEQRSGYDAARFRELRDRVSSLAGGAHGRRELVSLEELPPHWTELWRRPSATTADDVAVLPASSGRPGQVGTISIDGTFGRWSSDGQEIGLQKLRGRLEQLLTADLDGDRRPEWLAAGSTLIALDDEAAPYWESRQPDPVRVDGVGDVDGRPGNEIVLAVGERIVLLQNVPLALWTSVPLGRDIAAQVSKGGGLLAQADEQLLELDGGGRVTSHSSAPPGLMLVTEPAAQREGGTFAPRHGSRIEVMSADLDGDGATELVLSSPHGVVAYDDSGKRVLWLRSSSRLAAAAGDLDSAAGAELVVFVEQYGLIALGKRPTSGAAASSR